MNTTLELLKLAIVGLVAGFFSSFIANRDYRQKKWWELRVEAYQSAIEALSDLVYYYEKHWNAEIRQNELTEEFKTKLSVIWDASFQKVRRSADSGAFLFSENANKILTNFMEEDDAQSYFEHIDTNLAKAKTCLNSLVACSKVDLKLSSNFLRHIR